MRSVGLDLGVREVSFCEVRTGSVVARRTVASLEALDDVLGRGAPPATIAIEACREAWHWHDALTALGHRVLLVDTTRSRRMGIGQHGRKTDRIDAETLARAVERGGIPVAHVLSPRRRRLRDELAVRRALVETRAQYVTTIRGIVRAQGEKLPSCDVDDFIAMIQRTKLPEALAMLLQPLVAALRTIDQQVAVVDTRIDALGREEPMIAKLTTVPGVGAIVAAMFVAVVDDAKRFRDGHQLQSYLGLVPSEDSSGGRDKRRLGAITKHGNGYLRALLVQAAHRLLAIRADDPLKRWGNAIVKRRGRRIGVVAVARRIAGVLWAVWRHDTAYDAAKVGNASSTGIEKRARDVEAEAEAMKRAAKKAHRRTTLIERNLKRYAQKATAEA